MKQILLLLLLSMPAALQAQMLLTPDEIEDLVPDNVKGFKQGAEAVSKLVKLGEIRYSLCEKRFLRGAQNVKVLLFDYKEAPIMYTQAMRKWNQPTPIVTDSLVQSPVAMENCSGWESFNKNSNTSQIFLGICDRFFLSLSGENVDLPALQGILKQFAFEKFPK